MATVSPPSGPAAPGRAATLPPVWRSRGVCPPGDLYVAVRVGKAGIIHGAAGPFQGEADAKAHVAAEFDGHGVAVPFEMVFRSPPKAPPGGAPTTPTRLAFHPPPQAPPDGRPPGHPANPGEPPPTAGRPATP